MNFAIDVVTPAKFSLTTKTPLPRMRVENEFAGRRIHFMGAGGIGVSALMELCAARGAVVSGCDCSEGGQVAQLRQRGFHIDIGHCASHVADCDELVITAAVNNAHPEVKAAESAGKKVSARMNMLGRIARTTRPICVTGAHGKTSTTWLIAHLLRTAGRDPSVLVGGVTKALNGNVHAGKGTEFVVEVDESDNRLHEVVPMIPVLTNIDNDHLEHYGTIEAIEEATTRFLASVNINEPDSILIGCGEDTRVVRALNAASIVSGKFALTYGFSPKSDIYAWNMRDEGLGWTFDAHGPFGHWKNLYLPMPGRHNVLNALAAICVGWRLNIGEKIVKQALASAERVGRRFEIKGMIRGVRVVDDYGHHPTEIAATLKAARSSTPGRLCVLFQPHRYTRTFSLMDDFARCFLEADIVFLLPIYAASEKPIPGIDHIALANATRARGHHEVYTCKTQTEAINVIADWARDGDTVVTQGAGDVTRAAGELVSRL